MKQWFLFLRIVHLTFASNHFREHFSNPGIQCRISRSALRLRFIKSGVTCSPAFLTSAQVMLMLGAHGSYIVDLVQLIRVSM